MRTKKIPLRNVFAIIVLLSASLLLSCGSNDGYTIKGSIEAEGLTIDSVHIYDFADNVIASAPVKNNKFELRGKTDAPRKMLIGSKKNQVLADFILENETYTVFLSNTVAYVKGGAIHQAVLGFLSSDEYRNAMEEFKKAATAVDAAETDPEKVALAQKNVDEKTLLSKAIEDKAIIGVLEGEYPPLTKLFALNESFDFAVNYPTQKRLELLDKLEKELGNHELIAPLRENLTFESELKASLGINTVGVPFVNVVAHNRQHETVDLAAVVSKNRYTILEFWASWCGACREEIPNLKKAYEKYHPKGLEIYAIALDEKEEYWLTALGEEKTPWINVRNTEGFKGEILKSYGITKIPISFLISNEGEIVALTADLRGKELNKTLEELLK